jgi:hypothetical protein
VVTVAGWCVREMRGRRRAVGQKSKTEPLGLGFGRAIGKDGERLCGEVVGRCVRGGNGDRVAGSRNEREAAGCRPKVENRAAGARFRARRRKWGWRAIGEGGGMAHMRWCWWGGAAFGRASGGGGLRPKKSKP